MAKLELFDYLNLPASLIQESYFVTSKGQRSSESLIEHLSKECSLPKASSVHFVTGSAGSGKSTFAKQLFEKWISLSLNAKLLHLNRMEDIQKLGELEPFSHIILDALDEYTDKEEVVEGIIEKCSSSCNFVVCCCRPSVISSKFSSKIIQLDLFNGNDIWKFINSFFLAFQHGEIELMASTGELKDMKNCSDLAYLVNSFICQDGDYPVLFKNPLVLTLFMITLPKIFSNITSIATAVHKDKCNNKALIMNNFIAAWFHYYAKKNSGPVDIDTAVKFMYSYSQNLAQFIMKEGNPSESYGTLAENEERALLVPEIDSELKGILTRLSSKQIDELLKVVKCGALVYREKRHFRFFHIAILEYFFSKELCAGVLGAINERMVGIHLNERILKNIEVLNFLADIVNLDPHFEQNLWGAIDLTKHMQGLQHLASNAITVLNYAGKSFSGKDLSFVRIPYADLSQSLCGNTNFSGSDLHSANFKDAYLSCANFSGTNLNFATFGTNRSIPMAGRVVQVKCFQNRYKQWHILAVCDMEDSRANAESLHLFRVCAFSFDDFEIVRSFDFDYTQYKFRLDAFCTDTMDIIVCSSNKLLKLWNFEDGKEAMAKVSFTDIKFEYLCVHPTLRQVYIVEKGTIQQYLLNLRPETPDVVITNSTVVVNSWVCESSDYSAINNYLIVNFVQNNLLILSTNNSRLTILSPTLNVICTSKATYRGFISMTVATEKEWIFVADRTRGFVRIFNYNLEEISHIPTGHSTTFVNISCSADGRFVSSNTGGNWKILDTNALEETAAFPEGIMSCDFLPSQKDMSAVISHANASIEIRYDMSPDINRRIRPQQTITKTRLTETKLLCSIKHGTYRFINKIIDLALDKDFETFHVVIGMGLSGQFNYGDACFCYPYKDDCVLYVYYLENYNERVKKYWVHLQNYRDETVPIKNTELKEVSDKSKFAMNEQYFAFSTKCSVKVRTIDRISSDCGTCTFVLDEKSEIFHLALHGDILWVCIRLDMKYVIHSYRISNTTLVLSYSVGATNPLFLNPVTSSIFWCCESGKFFKNGEHIASVSLKCNIATSHVFRHNDQEWLAIATLASKGEISLIDPTISIKVKIGRPFEDVNSRIVLVTIIQGESKRVVKIPLWYTPSFLHLYERSACLYLISVSSQNSRLSIVEINVDTCYWKVVKALGISTQLDTEETIFNYVYGNFNLKEAPVLSAVEGDKFVSRCELLSPVLYSTMNVSLNAPILQRSGKEVLVLNENSWVISVVKQETQSVFDHVYLILEGSFNCRRLFSKMHLIVAGKQGMVNAYSFGLHDQERIDELRKSLAEKGHRIQQWQINKERGLLLIDNVLRSKQEKWEYKSINNNCATWARKQLKGIQIEIAEQWYNFIVHFPSDLIT